MTATNQKPEPQPVSRFKKAVTGGALMLFLRGFLALPVRHPLYYRKMICQAMGASGNSEKVTKDDETS